MSKPQRSHTVPRAYLQRFSDEGRVLVRWRDQPDLKHVGVQKIAIERGFYEVEGPDGERSSAVEQMLAELEGEAITAMRLIDQTESLPAVATKERLTLAAFLTLQFTRTPEHRGRVLFAKHFADYVGERELTAAVVAEYLEHKHLGFRPRDREVRATLDYLHVVLREPKVLTQEFAIQLMLQTVEQLVPVLLVKHWSLEIARKRRLITSDTPIVIWRRPSIRDQFEGVGLGNAEEVRFPLDPGKQLVLTPAARTAVRAIDIERVRACNQDIADGCHRFILGNPQWPRRLEVVKLAPRRPVVRFNTGPLYERGPGGGFIRTGADVLHMRVPRR